MWALGLGLGALYVVTTIVIIVAAVSWQTDHFDPLRNPSPQRVENRVVKQGGVLIVYATKCNDTDEPVAIQSTAVFRHIVNRNVVPYREGFGARDPGCKDFRYENQIPVDLPVGEWRVEGIDITRRGAQVQQEAWYSDPFEVTE